MSKRIIFLRHGEQPTLKDTEFDKDEIKKLEHEDSSIGLTLQGSIRAYMMPKLINKLFGKKAKYQIHTYTNCKDDEPVARAYYTTQLLRQDQRCSSVILYNKSENIYELVENLKNSKSKNIIVCWEHGRIPKILKQLLALKEEPDYGKITKGFNKKSYKLSTKKVTTDKLAIIQRCAPKLLNDNILTQDELITDEKELEYAPIWDVNLLKNKYSVYPGLTINKSAGNNWNVKFYL